MGIECVLSTRCRGPAIGPLLADATRHARRPCPAPEIGHDAALSRPHLRLTAPAAATATWHGDNSAQAQATLALALSGSLTVDGVALPLGAPSLPPLAAELELAGDGSEVTAELRVHAAGELWSWADLIELSDLELVLGAGTPPPSS